MPLLKVQLNHPGKEKPFRIGNGYQKANGLIIREWNDDPKHYRKFIKNEGEYLNSLKGKPQTDNLLLWGEWEGNSKFNPLNYGKSNPNGIHEPFHSTLIRGNENTDPYVYGEFFKYATCKQSGQVSNLDNLSLILFGSTYPSLNAFYLDTVFVVRCHEPAYEVCKNEASNYTLTYNQETLEQLGNEYLGPDPSESKKLYHGQTWWDDNEYFSFVPCKPEGVDDYNRFKIDLNDKWFDFSSNPTGKSFLRNCKGAPDEAWKLVVDMVLDNGFNLGIRFKEPITNDELLRGFLLNQTTINGSCGRMATLSQNRRGCR